MKTSPVHIAIDDLGLTKHEMGALDQLNKNFFTVYHVDTDRSTRDEVLRQYIGLKLRIVNRGSRFGIINNRLFVSDRCVYIPYVVDNILVVFRADDERSEMLQAHEVRGGAIVTDKMIFEISGVSGEVRDLEPELFDLDVNRCKTIRISHIRDMATQLERMSQSANLADTTYLLRTLVAQTSLLSFKEYLSAKNLQIEVRRLRAQLLNFLNSPLSYRVPFLIRILVRNISSVVAKPKLIDSLWNDTIELSEVHLRGSQIVNEIRRSTHHAIGRRTLLIVQSYLDYLENGATEGLTHLGYSEPGPADKKARDQQLPKEIVGRILANLQELLGSSDALARVQDWQTRYSAALVQSDADESLHDVVEQAVTDGIKDRNRWMFYHHLRIIKSRITRFVSLPQTQLALKRLTELLALEPDEPGFNPQLAEANLRGCIDEFIKEVRLAYEEDLFRSIAELTYAFREKAYIDSFRKSCRLRRQLRVGIIEGDFPEQRLLSYELDCLLEEISFLSMRHIHSSYEERGVNFPQCIEIIRACALNLSHDGLHSRQLRDLVEMLIDPSRTYAELANVLEQVRRNYQHILRQLTMPFELMANRLEVEGDDLRIALANMQRFLHDLNSMAAFADTALTHIDERVEEKNRTVDGTNPATVKKDETVVHLSDREQIHKLVRETDSNRNLRVQYGSKGSGLIYISYLSIPTPDGFILPTSIANRRAQGDDGRWIDDLIREHLEKLESDLNSWPGKTRKFGDPANPLLLAVRGGSVFSMPGILQTVLFAGMNDKIAETLAKTDPWHAYDSYRRFLASYAQAVWGMDVERYDLIEIAKESSGVEYKEDLKWEAMREVVEKTKEAIRKEGHGDELDKALSDPLYQLTSSARSVMNSWDRPTCQWYRNLKSICDNWNTAVVVQEMSSGNHKNERIEVGMDESAVSLTGVVPRTMVTELGVRRCTGEFKFSACGEDLVGGLTTSKSFLPLDELINYMPMLNRRLNHKVARLRSFMGTDQEIEFTVDRGSLSVLQSRAAEIGANKQIHAFKDPGDAIARGLGIRGTAFRGMVAFDEADYQELRQLDLSQRDDVDGILLVLENPTPADIPLVLLAEGLLASSGGSTSHAAVSVNGIDGKDYCCVMSVNRLRVNEEQHQATLVDLAGKTIAQFGKGDIVSIHGGTGMVYLGSKPIGNQVD